MQIYDPFEHLSVSVIRDLLRDVAAQTSPKSKKCSEGNSHTKAYSLYTDLEAIKGLWTIGQLCAFTGWHPGHVARLIKQEGLPAHQFRKHGHYKLYTSEVCKWMQDHDVVNRVTSAIGKADHASADLSNAGGGPESSCGQLQARGKRSTGEGGSEV